jgi:hypothetical protein
MLFKEITDVNEYRKACNTRGLEDSKQITY